MVGVLVLGAVGISLLGDAPVGRVVWTAALVLLCWGNYYFAHWRLAALKQQEGWYAGQRRAATAELRPRRPAPALVLWGSLPAIVLLLLTLSVGLWRYPTLPAHLAVRFASDGTPTAWADKSIGAAFAPVFSQALLTLLLVGTAWIAGQVPRDIDPEAPEISAQMQQRKTQMFSAALLFLAACLNSAQLLGALQIWDLLPLPGGWTAAALAGLPILGVAGTLLLTLGPQLAARRAPGGRPAHPAGVVHRDDDRFWRAGIFYFNRDDPALVVNRRFGVGWTLNHAHPVSWIVIAGVLGLVLLGLILGVPIHRR